MRTFRLSSLFGRSAAAALPADPLPGGSPEGLCAGEASAFSPDPAPASPAAPGPSHAARAEGLRGDLDAMLDRMRLASADASELSGAIARLEAEAARVAPLAEENADLARRLEERGSAIRALEERGEQLARDLARALEETARGERRLEQALRERGEFHRAHENARERLRALGEKADRLTFEIESAHAASEKSDLEIATLRSRLAEQGSALAAAEREKGEMRIAAKGDAKRIEALEADLASRETRIDELRASLAGARGRQDETADALETLRDEHRALELERADLAAGFETRSRALTAALSQERSGREVTEQMLDETRAAHRSLAEENRHLKDQAVRAARDAEQVKHELDATRSTMREHGDRLGEASRRLADSQGEVSRLEAALAEARKDARALTRKSERLERAEERNDALNQRLSDLQAKLDDDGGPGEGEECIGKLVALPVPARKPGESARLAPRANPITSVPRAH